MRPVLSRLLESEAVDIFSTPVDPVRLRILDYDQIIKRRMDLGTIKKNLGRARLCLELLTPPCTASRRSSA